MKQKNIFIKRHRKTQKIISNKESKSPPIQKDIIYFTRNEQSQRLKPLLAHLSQKYEVPEMSLLLVWLTKHPIAISPVIGTTSPTRIKATKRTLKLELED